MNLPRSPTCRACRPRMRSSFAELSGNLADLLRYQGFGRDGGGQGGRAALARGSRDRRGARAPPDLPGHAQRPLQHPGTGRAGRRYHLRRAHHLSGHPDPRGASGPAPRRPADGPPRDRPRRLRGRLYPRRAEGPLPQSAPSEPDHGDPIPRAARRHRGHSPPLRGHDHRGRRLRADLPGTAAELRRTGARDHLLRGGRREVPGRGAPPGLPGRAERAGRPAPRRCPARCDRDGVADLDRR